MIVILIALALAQSPPASQYFKQALDAIRHGDFQTAETQAKAGLKLDPNSPAGYDLLGIAADGLGNSTKAEQAFREAIRLNSRFIPAHNDLARSLYRRGMVKEAIGEFQSTLRLDPRNLTANYNLGLIARDQKRYAEAARYLQAAREIRPDAPSLFALTGAYLGSGKKEEAVAVAKQLPLLRATHKSVFRWEPYSWNGSNMRMPPLTWNRRASSNRETSNCSMTLDRRTPIWTSSRRPRLYS